MKRLELDIFIPSLKRAIELDGDYWHSSPERKKTDKRKNKECADAGIKLLRLPYMATWHRKNRLIGETLIKEFLTDSVCNNYSVARCPSKPGMAE